MIVSALINKLETLTEVTNQLAYHAKLPQQLHAIYPLEIPQASGRPAIRLELQDGTPQYALNGDVGLAEAIIELSIQTEEAQGYGRMESIKESIRQGLRPVGNETWGNQNPIHIQGVFFDDLDDRTYQPAEKKFRVFEGGFDLTVMFNRLPVLGGN